MLFLQVLSVQHGGRGRQRERHGDSHAREPRVGEGPPGPGQHQQSGSRRQLCQGQQQWACGQCTGERSPRRTGNPERGGSTVVSSGITRAGRSEDAPGALEWGCSVCLLEESRASLRRERGLGGVAEGVALHGEVRARLRPGSGAPTCSPEARPLCPQYVSQAEASALQQQQYYQWYQQYSYAYPYGYYYPVVSAGRGGLRGLGTDRSGVRARGHPHPRQRSHCHRAASVSAHPAPCPLPCPHAPCGGLPGAGLLRAAGPPPTLPAARLLCLASFLRLLGGVLHVCS